MNGAAAAGEREARIFNLANQLTMLRLALVPVFGWLLLSAPEGASGHRLVTASVFMVASATDLLDGRIARERGLVTRFGIIADPVADKALVGVGLIGLSLVAELPWWITVLMLVRELAITALRFWVIRWGAIAASRGGKLKTALQTLAITVWLLPGKELNVPGYEVARVALMLAALVIASITGADYVRRALALRSSGLAAQAGDPG